MPVRLPDGRLKLANETGHDRIKADDKHNRDGRSCRLGGERRVSTTDSDDDADLSTNQLGREGRQLIKLAVGPSECDVYVLAL